MTTAKPELQGGDDVRATVNGIVKWICESDPADPSASDTVCIDVLALRLILLQHLSAKAEPAQAAQISYEIWQDGEWQAMSDDFNDALHYVDQYSQDGPVELRKVTSYSEVIDPTTAKES